MPQSPEPIPPRVVRLRRRDVRWTVRSSLEAERLARLLEDPEAFLRTAQPLFRTTPAIIGCVRPPHPDLPSLALRHLTYARPLHRLRDTLRPTRAHRAFRAGLLLQALGIRTPRPLAAGSQRRWGIPIRAFLVTEWVPHARTLGQYTRQHHGLPPAMTRQLAAALALLHRHRLSHRDLKESNLLVDAADQLWLIDLDGMRLTRWLSEFLIVVDLTRLAWEFLRWPGTLRWQGLRFLHHYCRDRGIPHRTRHYADRILGRLRQLGPRPAPPHPPSPA